MLVAVLVVLSVLGLDGPGLVRTLFDEPRSVFSVAASVFGDHRGVDPCAGLHRVDEALDRGLHPAQEWLREQSHDEAHQDDGQQVHDLSHVEVRELLVLGVLERPEHHLLDHPQEVEGAEDHAGGRERDEDERGLVGAPVQAVEVTQLGEVQGVRRRTSRQDHELPDEPHQAGHARGCQADDDEEHREDRHLLRQAAELRQQTGMPALVDDADREEEPAGRDAVGQRLVHRAGDRGDGQRDRAQGHEAEVTHRGVGHQLLHVLLHVCDQRAVDDADHREDRDERSGPEHRIGEERNRVSDQSVRPHLEENRRQDDRAGGRRFDVRVRQPGVQREDRDLDQERERERDEEQTLLRERERVPCPDEIIERERVGTTLHVEVDDGDQHQHRADHRV